MPDPEVFDSDEPIIVANVKSPVFKCMVKPYHERTMAEQNSIYIALILFIDILVRDRTYHDEETKQAHSYATAGRLF